MRRRTDSIRTSTSDSRTTRVTVREGRAAALVFRLAAVGLVSTAGCAVRRAPAQLPSPPPCLVDAHANDGDGGAESIRWVLREEPNERSALDAWCWGVGGPVFEASGQPRSATMDSIVVVNWNTHIGSGDLTRLIGDLRSGRITGSPVDHFVMMLQEAHRVGEDVPGRIDAWTAVARTASDPAVTLDRDILDIAEANGLSILYAPSMRSDRDDDGIGEDRGNAILSTLPLRAPLAIELPWERQRRVVVAAEVQGRTATGDSWRLRVVSAHLDNRARFGRILRSFGAGRAHQARVLAGHLADGEPTVIGADLNTWNGGAGATAARVLREQFPLPVNVPPTATSVVPGPLPDLQLDYLMFRLDDGWSADYRVLEDAYGSDHRPLVGWIRVAPAAPGG